MPNLVESSNKLFAPVFCVQACFALHAGIITSHLPVPPALAMRSSPWGKENPPDIPSAVELFSILNPVCVLSVSKNLYLVGNEKKGINLVWPNSPLAIRPRVQQGSTLFP